MVCYVGIVNGGVERDCQFQELVAKQGGLHNVAVVPVPVGVGAGACGPRMGSELGAKYAGWCFDRLFEREVRVDRGDAVFGPISVTCIRWVRPLCGAPYLLHQRGLVVA